MRRIDARKPVQSTLEWKGGEFVCTVRLANQTNPSLVHCYEAAADTRPAAVQAVLEQIEKDGR